MYAHSATQETLEIIRARGVAIVEPDSGELASGLVGKGRMSEPEHIAQEVMALISQKKKSLEGRHFLVTAGATIEAIDPVRYLTNHSSGKMGYAIAEAAAKQGADVTLISGPVNLATPAGVKRINVFSAKEMHQAALEQAVLHQIFIGCAAVADFRPAEVAEQKMKKQADSDEMVIRLVKNPDIIAAVAALEQQRPFTVGFAAETQNVEQYAMDKLSRKKLDLICANDVSAQNQGFNSDNNALTLFWQTGQKELPLCSKAELGQQLIAEIAALYQQSTTSLS